LAFVFILFIIPAVLITTLPIFNINLNKPIKANFVMLPDAVPFEGALKPEKLIGAATKYAEGKLRGAETIVIGANGAFLFTGLLNGQVMAIDLKKGQLIKVAQLGNETDETICNDHGPLYHSKAACGRPLGMRLKPNTNFLYVADAYYGLFKVDVATKTKTLLLSSNDTRFGDMPLKMVNDLDFGENDDIYFIDSSYEREVNEAVEEHIEGLARGRLFRFNEKKNELEFLAENLFFPNGLQMMPTKDALLINENSMARIIKYYIKGPNKGNREVFADLPGYGDTILLSDKGTLLVPFVAVRNGKSVLELLGQYPLIRTIFGSILNLRQLFKYLPKYGLVAEYDLTGKPLRSWHDPTGQHVEGCTSVAMLGNKLFLGSFYIDHIALIDY